MIRYIQKTNSWNSWIEGKIQASEKRVNQLKERKRLKKSTKEGKEFKKRLKNEIRNSGVDLVQSKGKGAAFMADPIDLQESLKENEGLSRKLCIKAEQLTPGRKTIIAGKSAGVGSLAHELGHSKEDLIYRWSHNNPKNKIHPIKRLIEETRANLRGYQESKKLGANKKILEEIKGDLMSTEKYYLEKTYQDILKKIKRR